MKIQDAKKAYAARMDTLWTRRRALSQTLENCQQGGTPNVDRVEISRELSAVDAQYNEAQSVMESITARETEAQPGAFTGLNIKLTGVTGDIAVYSLTGDGSDVAARSAGQVNLKLITRAGQQAARSLSIQYYVYGISRTINIPIQ